MSVLLQAVDSCPTAFIVINQKGIIVETNKATADLFGYEKEKLIGIEIEKLIPSSIRKKHKSHIQNFFKKPDSRKMAGNRVLEGLKKDGSLIYLNIGINFFNSEGSIFGVANIVDMTQEFKMRKLVDRTQEVAKIGSWQLDLILNKCLWSKMTYKIHELDENVEVNVEDGINFYCLEHRPIIRECVEKAITDRKSWDVELKIVTTKKEEKWVRAIGTPIIENNKVVRLEGTFQDIHDQKLIQTEKENLLKKLQETERLAKIGHWEWTIEPEKLEWSNNLYDIWGIEQTKTPPLIADHSEFIHKEDRELYFSTIENAVNNKESYEIIVRGFDDSKIKYIKSEGVPVFDNNNNNLVGFFGTTQDITSQKESDERMKRLTHRLTLALTASNVGIWEWNLKTDELIWDEQMYNLYGVKKEDFEGAYFAWEKGLHPDDKERSVSLIKKAVKDEVKFNTEFRVIWPNGTIRYIRALASLDYDNNKKPIKMIGVNWDITKTKEDEEKLKTVNSSLERANSELLQFSYRSSHDLKAPLVSIRGLADIILEDLEDGMIEEVKNNIRAIKKQAITLETLVKDLLDLAKADVDDIATELIDFSKIIEEVFGLNRQLAEMNNIQMNKEVLIKSNWDLPYVRILQILNNLISNSVKYFDKKKDERFVNLKIIENNDCLEISVQDNGTGIPYKIKDEVFQMFKRYHSKDITGSGIGLYVLKKHVEALCGEIDLESSKEGTKFIIKIIKR